MNNHINKIIPNLQQHTAITHPPGPLMILAGAGTGKTFTLEKRILYLLKEIKVDPEHILAITYTEKASKELKNRIIQYDNNARKMHVNTFHSFCFKLLREYRSSKIPQLLETSEAIHMFLENFDDLKPFASDEFPMDPQRTVTDCFIPFFNRMKDELIDPAKSEIPEHSVDGPITVEIANQIRDLKRIYPIFQSWKRQNDLLDYGDMILETYNLLLTDTKILKIVQNQFRHIIIDEFQDNNFALNKIMRLIAGQREFITVVGDDDQVIYSFRGANLFNIKAFKKDYGHNKNFQSIALNENYRSSQSILDLANSSIKNNRERSEKYLKSSVDINLIKPIRFWGEKNDQLDFMRREILWLCNNGEEYRNIAVLCRTHSQASNVINNLHLHGIPVISQHRGLFYSPSIRDIIAWCQVICGSSYQDSGLYRIIHRLCGSKSAFLIFSQFSKNDTTSRYELINHIKSNNDLHPKVKYVISTVEKFRNILHKRSAGEIVWEITEHLKLLKQKTHRYSYDDHYALLNVGQFLKRAQDFTKRNRKNSGLHSFMIYVEAVIRSGGLPSISPQPRRKPQGVLVNTIHGVKGAEFPIVFLPFLRSASFPLNYRTDKRIKYPPEQWLPYLKNSIISPKEHHLEEERRLFYVGVTRAKRLLYILTPRRATSQFVKELPDNLMEDRTMKDEQAKINTHSDLKIKYEQKLQRELSRENYILVQKYSQALKIIDDHEKGKKINLKDSDWENELKMDLKKDFQPPVHDRLHLSASAIDTYKDCPLKFRLGKIDGVPQTAKKPELVFGNIIHAVLQRFHEPDKEITEKRILRILDEEWKSGDFDYTVREQKFKEQGKEMLIRYQNHISLYPPEVLKREEKFSFDIGPITIWGAIDRIDKSPDGIEIIDYKTSKVSTSAKSSLQLAIYSMYLEQLDDEIIGGIPSNSTLYFLRDEDKPARSHSFHTDEIIQKKEEIIEVAASIRSRSFEPKTGKHCDWCDYKILACPEWED